MRGFNLSIRILILMLLVTSIAVFAARTGACSSCKTCNSGHQLILSQNDRNMDNMNMGNMNNREGGSEEIIKKGYALSPVSHTMVKITKDTPFTIYGDRKYYFVSEQEKEEFLQNPKKYLKDLVPETGNKPPESHEHKGL